MGTKDGRPLYSSCSQSGSVPDGVKRGLLDPFPLWPEYLSTGRVIGRGSAGGCVRSCTRDGVRGRPSGPFQRGEQSGRALKAAELPK